MRALSLTLILHLHLKLYLQKTTISIPKWQLLQFLERKWFVENQLCVIQLLHFQSNHTTEDDEALYSISRYFWLHQCLRVAVRGFHYVEYLG